MEPSHRVRSRGKDAQTSFFPDTSFSSLGRVKICSQTNQECVLGLPWGLFLVGRTTFLVRGQWAARTDAQTTSTCSFKCEAAATRDKSLLKGVADNALNNFKRLPTYCTCMCPHMPLQVECIIEAFATEATWVSFHKAVAFQVAGQHPLQREDFVAH